jgi:hypothetical protein
MTVANATDPTRGVGDPNAEYESLSRLWRRSRAVCSGERHVKAFDHTISMDNMLIPFSPTMSQAQYDFYRAEAELPGIVSQFAKLLVGGLLRKQPEVKLPEGLPNGALEWILNEFGEDGSPLSAFLDKALWDELQTNRTWVYIDHPVVPELENKSRADIQAYKPFPILWKAENVINWKVGKNSFGEKILQRVVVRGFVDKFKDDSIHPELIDTVWVHELDSSGYYQIKEYEKRVKEVSVPVVSGARVENKKRVEHVFELTKTISDILKNGKRLEWIPAWPLNGSIEPMEPILSPLIDKEIALYNKISRRNHLLYGASTYTPVLSSEMSDTDFDTIVAGGLGSWIRIGRDDKITVLETPTAALADMNTAIGGNIEEMAKLGIRMLSPETAQSGVALEIRNASQTAQLGTLNTKISNTLKAIISFMLNWRYSLDTKPSDIMFSLSADFNPIPIGADWLRLATEWYESALIPRSVWLQILKHNDMVSGDYDDVAGQKEITGDDLITPRKESEEDIV